MHISSQETGDAQGAPYPSSRTASHAVGVLMLAWTLAYLDRQIIIILIEPLRQSMGLNDTEVSLLQGFAFSLFFVIAGIPLGRLVDRANRRNVLLVGIVLWSLMTVACSLATNFWQLFLARIGVGIGEACLAPATFSILSDMVNPKRRGTAMGLVVMGTSIGNGCSILLGGLLLQALGPSATHVLPLLGEMASWQLVFMAVGLPGIVVALLVMSIREPARRERANVEATLGTFFRYMRQNAGAFGFTNAAIACGYITGYAVSVWIPVILIRVHKMPLSEVALTIGLVLLAFGTTGAALGGALSDRFARRFGSTGRLGVLLMMFPIQAALMIGWYFLDSAWYSIIFAFTLAVPVAGNMLSGSSFPALQHMVPNELRGQTTAFQMLIANFVGLGLAPTAVALITDYVFQDPMQVKQSLIVLCAPASALGFVLALLARRPYTRTADNTANALGAAASTAQSAPTGVRAGASARA